MIRIVELASVFSGIFLECIPRFDAIDISEVLIFLISAKSC